jgi:hypothetical protein
MVLFEIAKQVLWVSGYTGVNIEIRVDKQRILAGNTGHLLFAFILPNEKIVCQFIRSWQG